ncbi:MAG: 16S rRNA (guanine(966)-N(2))-methyltransferase RsmD [Labilithrix sp.]|nr:16S rRNA (guanine(966)-N(2))-methyltransferase RsmD [Labilithrix sp.]
MRITGGAWRSRTLDAPRGTATRPTSDRVREALFSMLAADGLLDVDVVLDLYAGSGALAFEALSRGVSEAVLVEHARDALAAIRQNARALGAEGRIRVIASKVDRALGSDAAQYGLVLVDPPYADVRAPAFGATFAAMAARVAPGGALVLEHASADDPPPSASLTLDRSRRYGDTTLSLYRKPEP